MSGDHALELGSKVFSKPLADVTDRSVAFGKFKNAAGDTLDEGLALVMRGPKSYTGEDTIEFNIHGSPFIQQEVMRALIEAGCRQAGPGEFTQRAFLNGRLDLTHAESVADLIAAEHAGAHRLALDQLRAASPKRSTPFEKRSSDSPASWNWSSTLPKKTSSLPTAPASTRCWSTFWEGSDVWPTASRRATP